MADELPEAAPPAPAESAPPTPANDNATPPPAPPEKTDHSEDEEAAYENYLSEFKIRKKPTTSTGPKITTKGNTTSISTPLATSSQPVKPITVGGTPSKEQTQKPEIQNITGGKKTGKNSFQLTGNTEFDLPTPMNKQEYVNLLRKRSADQAEQIKQQAAKRQGALDAGATEEDADEYLENAADDENFDAYKTRRKNEKAETQRRADQARNAGANDDQIKDYLDNAKPGENYDDWQKRKADEKDAADKNAAKPNAAPAKDAATPATPAAADALNKQPDVTPTPPPEEEAPITPQAPAPQTAPTPIKAAPAPGTPPQLSPAEQASAANQMAANKARDNKAANNNAAPNAGPGTFKDRLSQGAGKAKENLKQGAKNFANQFNPVAGAKDALNRTKDKVNDLAKPLKILKNLGSIRKLEKRAKENEKQQRNITKKIKDPVRKLKRLDWLRRGYQSKKMFYGFLFLLFFASVIPVILLVCGIGEGMLAGIVRGYARAKMKIKQIKPQVDAIKAAMAPDQAQLLKLVQDRQQIAREKIELMQVFPTARQQQNPQNQPPTPETAPASQPAWNAPSDLGQNEASQNSAAAPTAKESESPPDQLAARRSQKNPTSQPGGILPAGLQNSQPANDNAKGSDISSAA